MLLGYQYTVFPARALSGNPAAGPALPGHERHRRPHVPIDGLAKVTGKATYGDDNRVPGAAYAQLVMSTVARGEITAIDQTAARAVPGVLEIFTHENVGDAVKAGRPLTSLGYTNTRIAPLASNRIHFAGQIVALVVAETFERRARRRIS